MIKRRFIIVLCTCLLTFLAQAGEKYRVVWVVDGDTIKIHTEELVRYIGIDTPEIRKKVHGKWKYDPEPLGEEARQFNKLLVKGKKVRLEYDSETKDRFGRLLAYVFIDDIFVNLEMIRQGYARTLNIPPNTRYRDIFKKAEKKAKQKKIGIWKK